MKHAPTFGGGGLTEVPTKDLEVLLGHLHRGTISVPITHPALVVAGLAYLIDKVGFLQTLDAAAARAVLVAVIAERRAAAARKP